jgi:hypothetical protein
MNSCYIVVITTFEDFLLLLASSAIHLIINKFAYLFIYLFIYLGVTGVWTQGSTLAKQALYCLSHTSTPFCSGYFGDGVL